MTGTETRGRAKRQLAETARRLAIEGKWREAIEVNQQLLERSPNDVDAYNRLGKALAELGHYRSAYEAYKRALELDPASVIAQRNLDWLTPLKDTDSADDQPRRTEPVRLNVFIEEVGKTWLDELVNPAGPDVICRLFPGDRLNLRIEGERVVITTPEGVAVGEMEPRIARRVVEFLGLGCEFEAWLVSTNGNMPRVIVRETVHGAAAGNRLAFPVQRKTVVPRPYLRDTGLRLEEPDLLLGEEDEEELDAEETDELEAGEVDEEETVYIEEAGAVIDEEEESAI